MNILNKIKDFLGKSSMKSNHVYYNKENKVIVEIVNDKEKYVKIYMNETYIILPIFEKSSDLIKYITGLSNQKSDNELEDGEISDEDYEMDLLNDLLEHYEDTEQYKKCSIVKNLIEMDDV